jgi:hypothetical protein
MISKEGFEGELRGVAVGHGGDCTYGGSATEKEKENRNDYDDEHRYIDHPFSAGPSEKSAFDGATTGGTDIRLLADFFPTIGTLDKCHAHRTVPRSRLRTETHCGEIAGQMLKVREELMKGEAENFQLRPKLRL